MMFNRPWRLPAVLLCSFSFLIPSLAAQQSTQQQPQGGQQQQQRPPNPFETVPTAPAAPPPQTQGPIAPPPPSDVRQTRPGQPQQDVIDTIEFRGSRRVPQDTLRALLFTKKGDRYSAETLHRDFMALWNTGRFDDLRLEREPGEGGWIIRFVVVERPVIRSI
jgi:outer membrane protein insertion porin family